MKSDTWKRVRARFEQLADLEVKEREEALVGLDREDPVIAREVRAWLAADRLAGSPLERSAPSLLGLEIGSVEEDPEPWIGRELGAHRIVEVKAQGGQGLVFLGERSDGSFARRVAIKVSHRHVGPGVESRWMRIERELTAQLDHPNIVRLLDAGEVEDAEGQRRSFLVLEHVEDTEFAAKWSRVRRGDCLAVMLDLCAAVQHAHGRGVVHGDLKPANIGFDDAGGVKLFDFGIARRIDAESGDGSTGGPSGGPGSGIAMTPAYASPEQIRGQASTTASDIHALGLLLFEGLTGKTVHDLGGEGLGLNRSPGGRPPRPSRHVDDDDVRDALRGDLDAICGQALAWNPEDRYASAAHLAADLRAHLERRPVLARGNRWRDHLRCFVRRQRLATAAILVAVLASLSVFVAISLAYVAGLYHLNALEESRDAARRVEGLLAIDLLAHLDSAEKRSLWIERTLTTLEDPELGPEMGPEASARLRLHLAEVLVLEGRRSEAREQWDAAIAELEGVRDLDPHELEAARRERARRFAGDRSE